YLHSVAWTALLLWCVACSRPLDTAVATSNAAAHALSAAHASLTVASRAEQLEAARTVEGDRSDPIVQSTQLRAAAEVGRRYRPAWAAYSAARAAWLALVGVLEVALAGGDVSPWEITRRLAELASAQRGPACAGQLLEGDLREDAPT